MKISNYIVLFIFLILAGCGAPKMLVSYKDNAEKATEQGNYIQAVEAWKQYFNQQPVEETTGAAFASAAQSAFLLKDINLALNWFDQARYKNFADAEMYSTLSKIYKAQNNLSKELSALEFFVENFGDSSNEINYRMFEVYTEVEMPDKALNVWEKLNADSKNELTIQKLFFQLNKEKENNEVCDSMALIILKKEAENVEALEWMAKKYYWLAENRYQEQMEKYNQNKTTKQYKILLNELDLVTADFKKSLPYFEKLWDLNPGEKYASYFANIYARFGDEKKVKTYQKYLQ
jgi:tetratricopeptide (TPR) repeat protein